MDPLRMNHLLRTDPLLPRFLTGPRSSILPTPRYPKALGVPFLTALFLLGPSVKRRDNSPCRASCVINPQQVSQNSRRVTARRMPRIEHQRLPDAPGGAPLKVASLIHFQRSLYRVEACFHPAIRTAVPNSIKIDDDDDRPKHEKGGKKEREQDEDYGGRRGGGVQIRSAWMMKPG